MKKLFAVALSALALLGVTACGGKSYDETVREAGEGLSVHAVGSFKIGDQRNEFKGYAYNKMTAVSVKQVSELSTDVADKLAEKELDWVYSLDVNLDGELGTKYPDVNYVKDGEKHQPDASFGFKAIIAEYNSEDDTYPAKQWIPNPENGGYAHVEALTDNIYMPPYQEDTDEWGMSWADNPCLNTEEAGTYTFIVAKYTTASSATAIGYGFAMIKK